MSKRNSLNTSKNTLFNYFAKSPATPKGTPKTASETAANAESSPRTATTTPTAKKTLDYGEQSPMESDDEIVVHSKRKRSRILRIVDSDESNDGSDRENECKNSKSKSAAHGASASQLKQVDSPVAKKKKIDLETDDFGKKLQEKRKGGRSLADAKQKDDDMIIDSPTEYTHNKLNFLKPNEIRDKNKRRPSDNDYDSGTLNVPASYLESLTPAMRQWWQLKSEHFDSIIFFKVGKFYELYHMDADIGVRELGFTYMKGEFAHSGFPEQSFSRMANSLVNRGFKVARCEQTETPEMMSERVKLMRKPTKFDKVVNREICQVVNVGTQVFGQQVAITDEYQPNYLMAVIEKTSNKGHRFGITFIDTSIGEFTIGEFDDDKQCSRLLTLFAHYPPVLLLYERGATSSHILDLFKTVLANRLKEALLPESQFWNADKTLKVLSEQYVDSRKGIDWPDAIKITQDSNDHLGLTSNANYRLALRALGGCIWYLKKCIIDEQILAMARFTIYLPPDIATNVDDATAKLSRNISNKNMVLDSITLSNLKIFGDEKSLFNTIDNCCTKFGKRLLNYWTCSPSCERSVIVERQIAVQELMDNQNLLSDVRQLLGTLPDLERQLAQIHTFGNKNRATNHPDGRAILYEQKTYNKKKIQDFVSTILGIDSLLQVPNRFSKCSSALLKRLTQLQPIGEFPDIEATITFFKNGFDFESALKDGVIAPAKGVDPKYDATIEDIKKIEAELATYLITQEKYFGCRIQYVGNDKKRYELEIPESNARKADERYSLEGQRKGAKPVRRFTTNETREFLKSMQSAEERRNNVLNDLQRRMFEKFSREYNLWKTCVDFAAIIDCLTSLAVYGNNQNEMCFPEILPSEKSAAPIIEITEGSHPCLLSDGFIPNGIVLGGEQAPAMSLLTGPNMGGKSTLMRQVGLLVILAQIGSPIPAKSARLSIIDRIFTRLGAQDDILAGHSTFLVELNETSAILKHATANSLVLLDELGRGTATYDGTAIAAAVVDFLANLKCRALFSTHYHNLIDYFHNDDRISLGHMACMVENEGDNYEDPTQETVTFLYKYTSGACPKSYGFNAAKLAGMPLGIIKRAFQYAKKVENIGIKRKLFSRILSGGNCEGINDLLHKIEACVI